MTVVSLLNKTEERIQGCLYSQALGDAMGMPSELWTKRRVIHFFGWIDRFLRGVFLASWAAFLMWIFIVIGL